MNQAAGSGENTRLIVLISVVATIGGFLFGFDSGVINGTQDGLHQAFRSGEWMQGFEIASMLLGCAVGAFSAGRLADRLGRRNVLILSAVMFLLSALGAGAAASSGRVQFGAMIVSWCSATPNRKAVSPPALMILSLILSPGLAVKVCGSLAGLPLIR